MLSASSISLATHVEAATAWRRPRTIVGWCVHDLRNAWWAFFLVPPVLTVATALFAAPPNLDHADVWTRFGFNTVTTLCIGGSAVLSNAILRTAWERRLGPRHPARYIILYPLVVGATLLVSLNILLARERVFGYAIDDFRGLLLITAVMVLGIVALIVASQSRLKHTVRQQARRTAAAQHEARTAEMRALQAHLNPHFLFNALNTLANLVEERPRHAVDAIERLSYLLRYSMPREHELWVSLRRELNAVRDYLELQSLRFESRLRYSVDVDPSVVQQPVPRFLLQPLVENAVTHAVATSPDGADVLVRASRQEKDGNPIAVFLVEDSGDGTPSPGGCGQALENLARRLELHYQGAASLQVRRKASGFAAQLQIPIDEYAAKRATQLEPSLARTMP